MDDALLIPGHLLLTCNKNDINIGHSTFSVALLKTLLTDKYYPIIKDIYKKESSKLTIRSKIGLVDLPYREFSISSLSRAFGELLLTNIDDKEFDRILSLREKTSLDSFIDKYNNKVDILYIDNMRYKIKYKDIIDFITLDDDFYNLAFEPNRKEMCGIPRDRFLYAVKHTFDVNEFTSKYVFPDYITQRLHRLSKYCDHDFEAVNQFTDIRDKFINRVVIRKDLYEAIAGDIPKDYDYLDSAIHIYIKLCQTLKYDPLFYMASQKGEVAKEHEDLARLSRIHPGDNIVCYEFNMLYAFFLRRLGINFDTSNVENKKYGGMHTSLFFRAGKFLVNADAVKSILYGDLTGCKAGMPLNGLNCFNMNQDTREEFKERVEKVYSNIYKKEPTLLNKLQDSDYLKVYRLYPFSMRVYDFLNELGRSTLDGLDAMGNALRLRKAMFDDIERDQNIKFNVICDNSNNRNEITSIISIGDGDYQFFEYKPGKEIRRIDRDYLSDMFENGEYTYVRQDVKEIPGISISSKYYGLRRTQ